MPNVLQIFVCSMCYELRDLRVSIKRYLEDQGMIAQLSEDSGFPRISGMKPYATCLKTLEECQLVVTVIEKKYGTEFKEWEPYSDYNGLSPIHAEIRHALHLGKKMLVYIHTDTDSSYSTWKKNKQAYSNLDLTYSPEEQTLMLLEEIKHHDPAPYIEKYNDSNDIIDSLKKNLVNEVFASLKEQEDKNRNHSDYLLKLIHDAAPDIRNEVESKLNPDRVRELERLRSEREDLERELHSTQERSAEEVLEIGRQKEKIESKLDNLTKELANAKLMLTRAALRDVNWLERIRSQLMPKQPHRVPFHNDAEVALRGYHCSNVRGTPVLNEVTWSKLDYNQDGLHRGFNAGIIFRGSNFAPGITFASRRKESDSPSPGRKEPWWRLPNTYFGDYLELSINDDEDESPLSWRGYEFCVKNPEGETSDWVEFSYPFDMGKLKRIMKESEERGVQLLKEKKFQESIEPFRKAYVFSSRINGENHVETNRLREKHKHALDKTALSKLRFKVGDRIEIKKGEYEGESGQIVKIGLRQVKAYYVELDGTQRQVFIADEEVELETAG